MFLFIDFYIHVLQSVTVVDCNNHSINVRGTVFLVHTWRNMREWRYSITYS